MKTIALTRGKEAVVDNQDFEWLTQWKWHCDNRGYAVRVDYSGLKPRKIIMHRLIMDPSKEMQVDHINSDRLDNRQINLRICTELQNNRNHVVSRNSKTGVTGVCWAKEKKKWWAYIWTNGKSKHLGYYDDKRVAVFVRKQWEKIIFGDFAKKEINV